MDTTYITLTLLSRKLGLSKQTIKRLANQKKIPVLNIGNRLRFNFVAVQQALNDLAAKGGINE